MKRLTLAFVVALTALLAMPVGGASTSAQGELRTVSPLVVPPEGLCDQSADLGELSYAPLTATGTLTGVQPYPLPGVDLLGAPTIYRVTNTANRTVKIEATLAPGSTLPSARLLLYTLRPDGRCQGAGWHLVQPNSPLAVTFYSDSPNLFLMLQGCCGDSADPSLSGAFTLTVSRPAPLGAVTGRLVDMAGNPPAIPFGSIIVDLQTCAGPDFCTWAGSAPANADGTFSITPNEGMLPGEYRLAVTAEGYSPYRSEQFPLQGNTPYDSGVHVLARAMVIAGRLVDQKTGGPINSFFTNIEVQRCDAGACSTYNYAFPESDGFFRVGSGSAYPPLTAGDYRLVINVRGYVTKTVDVLGLTAGEQRELGDVALEPLPRIGGVKGRLLDAVTGRPVVSSNPFGYPAMWLYPCNGGQCVFSAAGATVGDDGRFEIRAAMNSEPLEPGAYVLGISVDGYVYKRTPVFQVGADQLYDLGTIKLQPVMVRWDAPDICDTVPPGRERCSYGATLVNLLDRPVEVKVWRTLEVRLGQTVSSFQPDQARLIKLAPNQSKRLTYSLDIPRAMPEGAVLCPRFYAGDSGPAYQFNPLATTNQYDSSFCLLKQTDGSLRQITRDEARELVRHERRP
jgi:hypothetical protein